MSDRTPFKSVTGRKIHWCRVVKTGERIDKGYPICNDSYWMPGYVVDGPITCKDCQRSKVYRAWLEKAGLDWEAVE